MRAALGNPDQILREEAYTGEAGTSFCPHAWFFFFLSIFIGSFCGARDQVHGLTYTRHVRFYQC